MSTSNCNLRNVNMDSGELFICIRTVGNLFFVAGLRTLVFLARPPPTPHHYPHFLWCQERVTSSRVGWRSVILSDENRFWFVESDGRLQLRCRPRPWYLLECIWSRHTGPIPGIMMWAYNSRSSFVFIEGTPKNFLAPLNMGEMNPDSFISRSYNSSCIVSRSASGMK